MNTERHPLEVMPCVAWREVIKTLSSADSLSLYNTNSYFSELMEPSKSLWNFPNVLPLVLGMEKNKYFGVRFFLNKTDMLKCRLICHAWRTAMDDFLDRLQETEAQQFQIHFHSESKMDRLLADWDRYPLTHTKFMLKNLRLGGRLRFDPNQPIAEAAWNAFWEKGYILLQTIGGHVTRIFIEGSAGGLSLTKIVQRYSLLIPHVKELKISRMEVGDLEWGNDFENENNEIDAYLTNNSFPPLPNLTSLVLHGSDGIGRLPISMINHLTRKYAFQLQSLIGFSYEGIPREYNLQMLENLRKLDIEGFYAEETFVNDFNFKCPLETLRIRIPLFNPLSVVKFLEKIQNLPIEDLCIEIKFSYAERIPESLKNITTKYLCLTVCTYMRQKLSFDFLKCFPNLENFELTWHQNEDYELLLVGDEKWIRLNEYLIDDGNIYQSNIWTVLPKLERLTYRRTRYPRIHRRGRHQLDEINLGPDQLEEEQAENDDIALFEVGEEDEEEWNNDVQLDENNLGQIHLDEEQPAENWDHDLDEEGEEDEEAWNDVYRKRIYTRQEYNRIHQVY